MQTRSTLAVCWHQRIGHLSKEKIVRLTDVLGSRLCYTRRYRKERCAERASRCLRPATAIQRGREGPRRARWEGKLGSSEVGWWCRPRASS
jgi:hypothetical protein